MKSPIGVFDSGYGGLTVLKELVGLLPSYDYLYLGDNARTPYGSRSFETVYHYTLECVKRLFEMDCELVLLACNTASAKALRTIQQKDLPLLATEKRVLGVIRPTTESIGHYTKTRHVGILGTTGTINSNSYPIEIEKFFPNISVYTHACPMWVPLIENNEYEKNSAAEYFIRKDLEQLLSKSDQIDTIVLACTHYPLLYDQIRKLLPDHIALISQGPIVARSLRDYLMRHHMLENKLSKNSSLQFLTTDSTTSFDEAALNFFGKPISSKHLEL